MSDQRFFDLAMKVIAGQSTEAERTELDTALAGDLESKKEFEQLRREALLAKEVVPLAEATRSSIGELPGYARKRLQTKVKQTLGRPEPAEKKSTLWDWRWFLVLAPVAALFVLLLWPAGPPGTVIQLAMLDTAGATRGGGDDKEAAALKKAWPGSTAEVFASTNQLEGWERIWPDASKAWTVKIIYDRAGGEVRVIGRRGDKTFGQAFPMGVDLGSTIQGVASYVTEQTSR